MSYIMEGIEEYVYGDRYPYHMPGHKRSFDEQEYWGQIFKHDVNYLNDNGTIYEPEGALARAQERAATLYNADETFFLVNGKKSGIMAAISGCVPKGGRLLIMKNSSRAAFDVAGLLNLKLSLLNPETEEKFGYKKGITVEMVEAAVYRNPGISAVYLTSPTIEGLSSEIDDIADFLHERKIPLIVDASYGSHFGFAGYLPINAVECGADVVIHEPSQAFPCPMQTGLLHINGSLVNKEKIKDYLEIYQTQAPSYILISGLDECMAYMEAQSEIWQKFMENRKKLSATLNLLKHICIFDCFTPDRFDTPEICKMILYPEYKGMDAMSLGKRLLKEYGVVAEKVTPAYILLTFSVCDVEEGYDRLVRALKNIDDEIESKVQESKASPIRDIGSLEALFGVSNSVSSTSRYPAVTRVELTKTVSEAMNFEKEAIAFNMSEGRICGSYITAGRDDVPILIPGERITKDVIMYLTHLRKNMVPIQGILADYLQVLRDDVKNEDKTEDKNDSGKAQTYVQSAQPEVVAEPEVVVEPVVEPEPEIVVEPVAEPVVEPVVEAEPEPVAELQPEVVAEPVVEPVAEPVVEPVVEQVPEVVVEAEPEIVVEPVVELQPEAVAEQVPEVVVEPVVEQVPEVVVVAEPEIAVEAQPEFVPEPEIAVEPQPEVVVEPVVEPESEIAVESQPEVVAEPEPSSTPVPVIIQTQPGGANRFVAPATALNHVQNSPSNNNSSNNNSSNGNAEGVKKDLIILKL